MTAGTAIGTDSGRNTWALTIRSQEFAILLVILAVGILITAINGAFFSVANLFDILRLATVNGIFSLAVLVVLLSGGIDVSFTAIGNLTSFAVLSFLVDKKLDVPVIVWFALAIVFGVLLGFVNGFFVARVKITAFIVTLGTSSLLFGASSFFLGTIPIINYPPRIGAYSDANLATVPKASGVGTSSMHVSVLVLVVMAFAMWLFLTKTNLGRSIYAVGGNVAVASRVGINVRRVYYVVYGLAGGISAVAGVTYSALARVSGPISLQGTELAVIAGTVLGGVSILGGRGSVLGALLGILLLTIVQSSLVLVGIPNTWQLVAVGIILVFGAMVPALRAHRQERLRGRAEL